MVKKDQGTLHREAVAAEEVKDWPLALEKLEALLSSYPDDIIAYSRKSTCLSNLGRYDDAVTSLVNAQERFPEHHVAFIEHARLLGRVGKKDASKAVFEELIRKHPCKWYGYAGVTGMLLEIPDYRAAEDVLFQALQLVDDKGLPLRTLIRILDQAPPEKRGTTFVQLDELIHRELGGAKTSYALLEAHAQLARVKKDIPLYLERVKIAVEAFPQEPAAELLMVTAREIALDADIITQELVTKPVESAGSCFASFESLGGNGAYGCEFGFVQRQARQEPLGLLRWSTTPRDLLIKALDADFKGVGDLDKIKLRPLESRDWGMTDTTYGMAFDHTHLYLSSYTEDEARSTLAPRMKYLARKLIEDLEDAQKIFVYRNVYEYKETEARALASALNRHGGNVLLYISRGKHGDPVSIRQVHAGLIVGFLDWFAVDLDSKQANFNGWLRICTAALELKAQEVVASDALSPSTPIVRRSSDPVMSLLTSLIRNLVVDQTISKVLARKILVEASASLVCESPTGYEALAEFLQE